MEEEGGQKANIVGCGSIATKDEWQNLSPIEVEAMGIGWATAHVDFYIQGAPVITCITDHLPLVDIWRSPILNMSPCLMKIG